MTNPYDPNKWLSTSYNSLKDFIKRRVDSYVKNNLGVNAGLQIYDVRFDWTNAIVGPGAAELTKTVIHFMIDDTQNQKLGFGPDTVDSILTPGIPSGAAGQEIGIEGTPHIVNFGVEIWASDNTGGASARLRAYEMLSSILHGDYARQDCREFTGGVEIMSYNGGRFLQSDIGDIRVYRVVDAELIVRVFGRKVLIPSVYVDEIDQSPGLEISDTIIVDTWKGGKNAQHTIVP